MRLHGIDKCRHQGTAKLNPHMHPNRPAFPGADHCCPSGAKPRMETEVSVKVDVQISEQGDTASMD